MRKGALVDYRFAATCVTAEEKAALQPQLARALDKRLELHSRRTMPGAASSAAGCCGRVSLRRAAPWLCPWNQARAMLC